MSQPIFSVKQPPPSLLGWSAARRLTCALAASALLWLAVAWALDWFQG